MKKNNIQKDWSDILREKAGGYAPDAPQCSFDSLKEKMLAAGAAVAAGAHGAADGSVAGAVDGAADGAVSEAASGAASEVAGAVGAKRFNLRRNILRGTAVAASLAAVITLGVLMLNDGKISDREKASTVAESVTAQEVKSVSSQDAENAVSDNALAETASTKENAIAEVVPVKEPAVADAVSAEKTAVTKDVPAKGSSISKANETATRPTHEKSVAVSETALADASTIANKAESGREQSASTQSVQTKESETRDSAPKRTALQENAHQDAADKDAVKESATGTESAPKTATGTLQQDLFASLDETDAKPSGSIRSQLKRFSVGASGILAANSSKTSTKRAISQNGIAVTADKYGKKYYSFGAPEIHYEYSAPVSAGISLRYDITNRLYAETGLRFTYLTTRVTPSEARQDLLFAGIPVGIGCRIASFGNLDLYGSAYGMPAKCVWGREGTSFPANISGIRDIPILWSAGVAPGVQYNFGSLVGIYAEPTLSYYFKNEDAPQTLYKENPFYFTLNIGVRFNL